MSALELPRAAGVASRLVVVDETGSTNDDLVALASSDPAGWPHFSVLATASQTGGKGRLGRVWQAPAGASLALSVLLRPELPVGSYGWLPLIAGLAMADAMRASFTVDADVVGLRAAAVTLKWPNDVLIGGRKVSGILAELLPGLTADNRAAGVVVGVGVNLTMSEDELPVPTATSLAIEGVPHPDADEAAAAFLEGFAELYDALVAAGGDAEASGVLARALRECGTLGREVRVELPGGSILEGRAVSLDGSGRLVVEADGAATPVSAGDVTHLRY